MVNAIELLGLSFLAALLLFIFVILGLYILRKIREFIKKIKKKLR